MENQWAEAGKIAAAIRKIAKGDTVFNEYAVISQDFTKDAESTTEELTVSITGKLDEPEIKFIFKIVKFNLGGAKVEFENFGTDDLNVFRDIIKTFD